MLQSEREEQLAGAELQSRSWAVAALKWNYFKHLWGRQDGERGVVRMTYQQEETAQLSLLPLSQVVLYFSRIPQPVLAGPEPRVPIAPAPLAASNTATGTAGSLIRPRDVFSCCTDQMGNTQ